MLRAIHLENFRSFADSGRIELGDLNVLIGPNSAGKSNLMTVIELALRGAQGSAHQPFALEEIPSFASFDSVLRRNGSTKGQRPTEFSIVLEWAEDGRFEIGWQRYLFRMSPASGAAFVHRAEYGWQGKPASSVVEAKDPSGREYGVVVPRRFTNSSVSFGGGSLVVYTPRDGGSGVTTVFDMQRASDATLSVVVRPHRPVPRSVYVLDDPMMNADDRGLIGDLLRAWSEAGEEAVRERIVRNLRTMMLASNIEVGPLTAKHATKLVEVRVTPQGKGRAVTLADVGYGVSQVLPLLVQDAQVRNGNLLVYQPEAHLHPLAQSRLADVFVASVKRGNRAYIETHSEHLVLRLQALIAGGEIAPERVRVLCVEHDGKKSNVHPMLFDARGVPTTPWPRGFLDTGLELARDLAQRRQSRLPGKKRDG